MKIKNNNLTEQEKRVLFEQGTERPFTSELLKEKRQGTFNCKNCDQPLFESSAKFDSGTGWPSFDQAIPLAVDHTMDTSHGMVRVEVTCSGCGAHLGHVFEDGPATTGMRNCINGVCLTFKEEQ